MIERATMRRNAFSETQVRESPFKGLGRIRQYREHIYRKRTEALDALRSAKTPQARERAMVELERWRRKARRMGIAA